MAVRPVTDAEQRLVIIRINPVVRRVVPIRQVLVPAGLTQSLTGAAELAEDVNPAVHRRRRTGVPFTQPVMAIAARTEQ